MRLTLSLTLVVLLGPAFCASANEGLSPYRSPVDVLLSQDNSWLVTANQTSNSISLVRVNDGEVLDEQNVGERPVDLAGCPDGRRFVVSGSFSNDVSLLEVDGDKLKQLARIPVGQQPYGVAVHPDGNRVFAALSTSAEVAVIDLKQQQVVEKFEVGAWPRYLTLSPDGTKLAVGCSGGKGVWIINSESGELIRKDTMSALNIGHMQMSHDGSQVYFPWVIYRRNPLTANNIRLGWVLATRIARVATDGSRKRDVMSLDPRGKAVADPHGLALTSDEQWLAVSASGTQELLVYKVPGMPFSDFGSGDHIPGSLLRDQSRFFRVPLGGRPMGLQIGKDDRLVYVTDYLGECVNVVDLQQKKVVRTISLGSAGEPTLVRQGESIFFDGRRSLDQWYSCQTCHYDGGTNAVTMDTLNDESTRTFKTVLPLYNVTKTSPWTWHGWQKDLQAAMKKSITSTMIGKTPSDEDVAALVAYMGSLESPPNPHRQADGSIGEAAQRGIKVFQSKQANCASCHTGQYFTDGEVHDVGTGRASDKLEGYNTPSLIGVYRKVRFLHDGRATSLDELLSDPHSPSKVSGTEDLSEDQIRDLVEYLKTL